MTLKKDINKLMEELYGEDDFIKSPTVRDEKIIHEPLYGTNTYAKPEIAIIDSPFVQRLKYINQLGLTYQVFPGARYSRFEHSIGVVNVASKFGKTLKKKEKTDDGDIETIRAAALLHDVGHGPFSHTSEIFMKCYPEMIEEMEKMGLKKPHEITSYYMVKSRLVNDFLGEVKNEFNALFTVEELANYIIGDTRNPATDQFKADIINGEFDADKLDYITRDGHFTGLPISVDIDRILHSVGTATREGKHMIILERKGITSLQQLLFDKVVLKHTVYNHHKVRTLDAMILLIYERIKELGISVNGHSLEKVANLMGLEDHHILNLPHTEDDILNNLISMVKNRRLFKKSLVISYQTVEDSHSLIEFSKIGEYPDKLIELRKILCEYVGCSYYEIAIDIPEYPSTREASQEIVKFGEDDFGPTESVFPTEKWLENFSVHLWNARIFTLPNDKFRKRVADKAISFFKEEDEFNLELNDQAIKLANIP